MLVIACIEHKVSLEAFRAIEAALVKHDNNMKDYSLVATDHHNCQSFKLFSLWQSQHAVCHCQESGKTATSPLQCPRNWVISQYRPVRREERGMFILHHPFNWCICLFLTLVSDGRSMTQAEKFLTFFVQGAMLICSIIWLGKRMLRVVVCGSALRWRWRGCPVFSVADLYCLKLFLR